MAVGVGLLGCGTVGSAVARVLLDQAEHLQARGGVRLELRKVLVREPTKLRGLPADLISTTPEDVIANPDIQIVVELIGGIEPANGWIIAALNHGKRVVTANKYLLAMKSRELFAAASANQTCICFEASCGGAIPIVLALTRGLLANEIHSVVGILNGTCNYILTQMTQFGKSYDAALKEAQLAGFAEADPHMDVSGLDSSHKLSVLASLAFGLHVDVTAIDTTGIASIEDMDLRYGMELGYVCKLLAIAERQARGVSLRVHPTFIPLSHPLGAVNGSYNAISVDASIAGRTVYYGRGAGAMPTASAVLADILEAAMGTAVPLFACHPLLTRREDLSRILLQDINSRHYLRIAALDRPGTIHEITGVLGRNQISISAVTQHESLADTYVPLVITTHEASDGRVARAISELDRLECIRGATTHLRILDQHE